MRSARFRPALNEALPALLGIRLSLQSADGKVASEKGALGRQKVGLKHSARSAFTAADPNLVNRRATRSMKWPNRAATTPSSARWADRPLHQRQRRFLGARYRAGAGSSDVVGAEQEAPRQTATIATEWARIACLDMWLTFTMRGAPLAGRPSRLWG